MDANQLADVVDLIVSTRSNTPTARALLVGISGIDASGKGFISARLAGALRAELLNVAPISADDWLNLPDVCINRDNPAELFYKHALRLDEMFERLILRLLDKREIDVVADCGDAKTRLHHKHRYCFRNVDIVLLEGIFLFKPAYRDHFNLKIWIECSFGTALQRAIARAQEGLPPAETKSVFDTIYFPAQRIHLEKDNPRTAADIILTNDNAAGTNYNIS